MDPVTDQQGALNTTTGAPPASGNSADTSAVQAPGIGNQAPQEQQPAPQSSSADVGAEGGENGQKPAEQHDPIPYERFQEVNGKYQELKSWDPVLQHLRELGFDTPEKFSQAIEAQTRDTAIRSQLDPIAAQLSADIETGKIDPDVAERLWQAERDKVLAAHDRNMYHQWQTGQELNQARTQFPHMDEEYVVAMARSTGRPIMELAQASHAKALKAQELAIANYNSARQNDPKIPPEGSGGAVPQPQGAPDPQKDPKGYLAWMDRQAAETARRYQTQ